MVHPLRVLLIEDNKDDAELINRHLRRMGDETVVMRVDSPRAMNAALNEQPWNVVLSDWNLPKFGALFALEMLKSKELDLPFIIVSGSIGEGAAVLAMKSGVHDYIKKQDLSRLIPAIERELREAEGRRARRQAEKSLMVSEERLQLVMRATNDAVRDWDLTTNGMLWNEGFQNLFGYHSQDIETGIESWYSRIHPDEKERVIKSCYGAINGTATVWSEEYRFRRADGTYAYVLDRGYILRGIRGAALRLIGAMTDFTARKQAEEALRKSERRIRTILDSSLDAIVGMDQEGVIVSWNPKAESMFGSNSQNAIGRAFCDTFIAEGDRELLRCGLTHSLGTNDAPLLNRRVQITGLRRDSTEFPIELSISAIKEGPYVHIYGFLSDISERKQAEISLQHTTEQLRQAQKMEAVGQLAGGVAHDFNNLLTVITGYTDLLMSNLPAGAPMLPELAEIRNAAERAAWLTRQLLAFSRRQVLAPQVLDLNVLIGNFDKMLRRLVGEDILAKTELAPSLARIKADPGQIEQILMNLAVNARDAMPTGGRLTIETDTVLLDESYPGKAEAVPPGRYVLLAVSDTGCGIDSETQKRVFEPFFTTKEPGKGTGLGLSTVYGIVKQSNGFIWLSSEPGQGTTFKIYFPAVDDDLQTASTMVRTVEQWMGVETILLVEDAVSLRVLTKKILELSGYTVLAAGNLAEALKLAEERKWAIHLLLTDVVMPEGSGPDVAYALKGRCPDLRVLYMSGYTGTAIVHQGILESGHQLFQKPFSPDALRQKVREVLDEPRPRKP